MLSSLCFPVLFRISLLISIKKLAGTLLELSLNLQINFWKCGHLPDIVFLSMKLGWFPLFFFSVIFQCFVDFRMFSKSHLRLSIEQVQKSNGLKYISCIVSSCSTSLLVPIVSQQIPQDFYYIESCCLLRDTVLIHLKSSMSAV